MPPCQIIFFFSDECRHLEFQAPANDVALINHVIATAEVPDLKLCRIKCYLEPRCVSLNLGPIQESSRRICEVCDADDRTHPQDLITQAEYIYQRLTKVSVLILNHGLIKTEVVRQ